MRLLALVLFSALLSPASGSEGDRNHQHYTCSKACEKSCAADPGAVELSWDVRFFGWTCTTNCVHLCTQQHHADRVDQGLPTVKYFGKWPFTRILGMQEIASVLFSVGNGLGHVNFLINRHKVPGTYWATDLMVMYAIVGINTWLWSAVFHARDTPHTEKLDYYFALMHTTFSTACALVRVFNVRNNILQCVVMLPFLGLFVAHVHYMHFTLFDYGWNMKVNVAVYITYVASWFGWALYTRRPYAWMIVAVCASMLLVALLEVLDFPPFWGIFDAHALWHAGTIPGLFLFYRFIQKDAEYESILDNSKEV